MMNCRRIDWRHLEFVLTDSKVITVSNCETDLKDKIELKDRLVKMSVGFGYLIVLTSSQGLIYKYVHSLFLPKSEYSLID